jgi:hypothetical protein
MAMEIFTTRFVEFVAVSIYGLGATFGCIGAVLYWLAYYQMKRTRIIGATALLLSGISLDTGWWMFTEFTRFHSGDYALFMVAPATLIIVKLFLALTIVNFVVQSVKEDKRAIRECSKRLSLNGLTKNKR